MTNEDDHREDVGPLFSNSFGNGIEKNAFFNGDCLFSISETGKAQFGEAWEGGC